MFGFLTPVRNEATDPLKDVAAANLFWQALPKDDSVAARQALCRALAESVARVGSSVDRLQALLTLDQHGRMLFDALLVNDVAGSSQGPSTTSQSWQAAIELCRAFGRAYGQFLRLMRENREFEGRRDCQSLVLLRLFRHRKRELLLRTFSEAAPPFSWREVHEAYQFAHSLGLLREKLPVERNPSSSANNGTLEREYVHVLVQGLMNGGNFSPGTASWVSNRIARWCTSMALTPDDGGNSAYRFVVDPTGDAGLVRSNFESVRTWLRLDMAPLLKSVRDEIASLSDVTDSGSQPWSQGRRLRALQRVNALCAADRPVVVRRGERARTALTVEVVMGLPLVLRTVRDRPEHAIPAEQPVAGSSEGTTTTGLGLSPEDVPSPRPDGAINAQFPGTAMPWRLTMVDQSDSGCRLHGPALAGSPPIPGALIAFRVDAAAPWNLAVVRRVRKRLAGKRVEIGAEYLGKNPHSVVAILAESEASLDKGFDAELPRIACLYIRESATHPVLPIKTLILPACGLSPGDRLYLRSRTSVHTIRLKEPLEDRADFIWSPFEILDHEARDEPESSQATSEVA
jgi:hypothetical protein